MSSGRVAARPGLKAGLRDSMQSGSAAETPPPSRVGGGGYSGEMDSAVNPVFRKWRGRVKGEPEAAAQSEGRERARMRRSEPLTLNRSGARSRGGGGGFRPKAVPAPCHVANAGCGAEPCGFDVPRRGLPGHRPDNFEEIV